MAERVLAHCYWYFSLPAASMVGVALSEMQGMCMDCKQDFLERIYHHQPICQIDQHFFFDGIREFTFWFSGDPGFCLE